MRPLHEKCESTNTVKSFCDCISDDESADVAAKGFCRRAYENSTSVTGDELVEVSGTGMPNHWPTPLAATPTRRASGLWRLPNSSATRLPA